MGLAAAILIVLFFPSSGRSSEGFLWDVAQVIVGGDELRIWQVPFIEYFEWPGCASSVVSLTTAANSLMSSGHPGNRNAANLLGATARLESEYDSTADTLHVQLDLSHIDEQVDYSSGDRALPASEIVPLIVECLRRNVEACTTDAHYLFVEVVGDPRFDGLTKTYPMRRLHN
jgi:hypothetical protein